MDFPLFIIGIVIGAFFMLVVDGFLNAHKEDKEYEDIEIWHQYFIAYTIYEKGNILHPISRGNAYLNTSDIRTFQEIEEGMWDYVIEKGLNDPGDISKEAHFVHFEAITYMGQGEKCALENS